MGGDDALYALADLAGKKRKSTRSRWKTEGVPIQNIGQQIYDAWKGKRIKPAQEPEELRRALGHLRELYARTRGVGEGWQAVTALLLMALGALPKVGERYRPLEAPMDGG